MRARTFPVKRFLCLFMALGVAQAGNSLAGDRLLASLEAPAQSGDVNAEVVLARYFFSQDDDAARARALPLYRHAAAAGNAEAMYALGEIQRDGVLGVKADWNEGMSLIQQAAELGNGDAIYELNYCCNAADGGRPLASQHQYEPPKDGADRLRWALRMTSRIKSPALMQTMQDEITRLSKAGYGAEITSWRVTHLVELEAAEDGDARSIEIIANDYLSGEGVKPDTAAAEKWFQTLSDDGEFYHQLTTARHYESGNLGGNGSMMALIYYTRAGETLRTRAEAGDRDAQTQLARLYDDNKLGATNTAEQAFTWYSRAAAAGDVDAQAALGRLYLTGRGTTSNAEAGVMWLTRAANNNDRRLSNDAGGAAIAGYQFDLANLYFDGTALPQDYYRANYWMELALSNLPDDNTRLVDDIAQKQAMVQHHMTDDQIIESARAINAWHGRFDAPAFAHSGFTRTLFGQK